MLAGVQPPLEAYQVGMLTAQRLAAPHARKLSWRFAASGVTQTT
jgi:hypothetical protein